MSKTDHSWCLVLLIWGGKYSDKLVEALVKSVKQLSKGCKHIVLITDHIRNDLSDTLYRDFDLRTLLLRGRWMLSLLGPSSTAHRSHRMASTVRS